MILLRMMVQFTKLYLNNNPIVGSSSLASAGCHVFKGINEVVEVAKNPNSITKASYHSSVLPPPSNTHRIPTSI